jgi:hypothetical protein
LSKNDFTGARALLSEKVINTVTPNILQQLKQSINTEKKMNGLQMLQDGNFYPMLYYKYADDKNASPLEYLYVLFDNDNTIPGLQPMKQPEGFTIYLVTNF